MTHTAVTTFSREGFEAYGRRFVETFLQHWPIPLVCYHESQPDVSILHDSLTWRNLDHDTDRQDFIKKHGNDPEKVGTAMDPNSQAIRFCHKVFAVTDAARKCETEWLLWLDADVETFARVDLLWLKAIAPSNASLAFLGRPHYAYTECGYVAYRVAEPAVRHLLEDMRSYYTSGEMFLRPKRDWHDSRCFDICRERSTIPKLRQHNISNCWDRGTHVWPNSPLGRFCKHHKGPRRKQGAYGAIVP